MANQMATIARSRDKILRAIRLYFGFSSKGRMELARATTNAWIVVAMVTNMSVKVMVCGRMAVLALIKLGRIAM